MIKESKIKDIAMYGALEDMDAMDKLGMLDYLNPSASLIPMRAMGTNLLGRDWAEIVNNVQRAYRWNPDVKIKTKFEVYSSYFGYDAYGALFSLNKHYLEQYCFDNINWFDFAEWVETQIEMTMPGLSTQTDAQLLMTELADDKSWNSERSEEIAKRVDMLEEWSCADGDNAEEVMYKMIEKLAIRIAKDLDGPDWIKEL